MLLSSDFSGLRSLWYVFRTFDSMGFSHPGCKGKGSKRDEGPTAEPKPESRKSKHRSILRQKNAPKKQI